MERTNRTPIKMPALIPNSAWKEGFKRGEKSTSRLSHILAARWGEANYLQLSCNKQAKASCRLGWNLQRTVRSGRAVVYGYYN